jgi:hypothetical protein
MAAFIHDRVFDNGLTVLDTEATGLYLCSQQPTTYTEAITTYALASKSSGYTSGSPADGVSNGRRVTFPAITDGTCSASGTATHFAVVDSANSRLLLAHSLSASVATANGATMTLAAFDFTKPDAA